MIFPLFSILTLVLCVGGVVESKVRVTAILLEPFMYIKDPGVYEGFLPDLLEKIFGGKDYFEISNQEDGKYGMKDETGKWDGMISKLLKNETDLAAADLTVTEQRMEVIAFSNPFQTTNYAALMTKALKLSKNINSFDDLVKHFDIRFGVVKGLLTQLNFKESQRETNKKIYSDMEKNPSESFVNSTAEGLQKVRSADKNFVLIMKALTAGHIANKDPCDLTVIESTGDNLKHAFAVKKNDTVLLKKINDKLAELGELKSLEDKWWKQNCKNALNLALKNVSGNFGTILLAYLVKSFF